MSKISAGRIIFADPLSNPDILYATGFMSHDPFLYFEADDKKCMVVSALELQRARSEAKKGINVINRDDLLADSKDKTVKVFLRAVLNQYPQEKWLVPYNFPVLYSEVFGKNLLICKDEFFPSRSTKNQREIREIEKALKVAEKAMLKAETIISDSSVNKKNELVYEKKPLTSEYLKSQINLEIVKYGAYTHGTIASSGLQCAVPHNTGSGVIKAGVPIIIDIFPRLESSGYWGDITRTFIKGRASKFLMKAYEAVKNARDKVISKIKPGCIPSLLHTEAIRYLASKGFKTGREKNGNYYGFFHGLGHGVGLEIHENPKVNASAEKPLERGNVITIEPGVYYSEWGGVRLEDIIVVTENGFRNLTGYPSVFEIE